MMSDHHWHKTQGDVGDPKRCGDEIIFLNKTVQLFHFSLMSGRLEVSKLAKIIKIINQKLFRLNSSHDTYL